MIFVGLKLTFPEERANLGVVSGGNARYYDITELLIGKSSGSVSASNIDIAYDASASCSTANISITVTS